MDAALTTSYRLVLADAILLYDVYVICKASKRGLTSVQEYTSLVAAVIHAETDAAAKALSARLPSANSFNSFLPHHNQNSSSTQKQQQQQHSVSQINLLWEYVHGVVLPFVVEELSQYPFWAAKVFLCTSDGLLDDLRAAAASRASAIVADGATPGVAAQLWSLLRWPYLGLGRAWLNIIADRYAVGGFPSLFDGCFPYLGVAFFSNIGHVEEASRVFLYSLMAALPRTLSQNRRLVSQRKPGTGSTSKLHRKLEKAPSKASPPPSGLWGMWGTLVAVVLAQPMLRVALHMVKSTELRDSSTFYAYYVLLSRYGLRQGLYTGLSAALAFSLLPFKASSLLGLQETVTYRCALRRDNGADIDSKIDAASRSASSSGSGPVSSSGVSVRSTVSSFGLGPNPAGRSMEEKYPIGGMVSVVRGLLTRHGVLSLFDYGYLTLLQVVPGFLSFALASGALWVLTGSSKMRERQLQSRRDIVGSFRKTKESNFDTS